MVSAGLRLDGPVITGHGKPRQGRELGDACQKRIRRVINWGSQEKKKDEGAECLELSILSDL